MEPGEHWESVYRTFPVTRVGWYREHLTCSLRLIESAALGRDAAIIDVGGGASTLVADLLDAGYSALTVADLSPSALKQARRRLGGRADAVTWLAIDVTAAGDALPEHAYDLWHDRAAFHFLTTEQARSAYIAAAARALKPGGRLVIGTFAEDGPAECAMLPVIRYTPVTLRAEFAEAFDLVAVDAEEHCTPDGVIQPYCYCVLRRRGVPSSGDGRGGHTC